MDKVRIFQSYVLDGVLTAALDQCYIIEAGSSSLIHRYILLFVFHINEKEESLHKTGK